MRPATPPRGPRSRRHGAGRPDRPPAAGRGPGDRQGGRRRARRAGGDPGWIYGRHAVAAALANPARRLYRLLLTPEAEAALAPLPASIAAEIVAGAEIAARLPQGTAHQGCALLADPLPPVALEDALAALAGAERAVVVVLDQVTDPGNAGAILRSAAAFGAAAVVLPERRGAEATAALAKAASGALETVALVRVVNIARALATLKSAGFWCVGLDAHGGAPLAEVDLSGRIALVLGAEGSGLRRLVADTCDIRARLPIAHAVESLNVAAAAAIALYETARRRG